MKPERHHRHIAAAILIAAALLAPLRAHSQDTDDTPEVPTNAAPEVLTETNSVEAAYDSMELLTEVMLHVHKQYVDPKSYELITRGALQGMLHTLDAHSGFLDPGAFTEMQEETSGKFSGIGIHIGVRDGLPTCIAPIEDTPAFRAGMLAGDKIVEIDGEKTQHMQFREVIRKLRGERGSKVKVTLARAHEEMPIELEIVRDNIEVPSVKGARIVRDGIGYVRITQFSEPTARMLQQALDNLASNKMDALVLDLRSNPGGLLRSAVEVAEKFLNKNDLVVVTRGRKGVHTPVHAVAKGDVHLTDIPMAVLVDGGSASASEIVAGALQDHKRAVVVGATTFGKASVQSIIPLKTDARCAIRLTTARYYTPNGRQIHDKGIEPDIQIILTPAEWRKVQIRRSHIENPSLFSEDEKRSHGDVIDRQLIRAVDLLEAIKIFRKK